jgi:hypothetical protein
VCCDQIIQVIALAFPGCQSNRSISNTRQIAAPPAQADFSSGKYTYWYRAYSVALQAVPFGLLVVATTFDHKIR